MGSHEVAGKGYVFTKTSQMASIGAIFTSTYHTIDNIRPMDWKLLTCALYYYDSSLSLSAFRAYKLQNYFWRIKVVAIFNL